VSNPYLSLLGRVLIAAFFLSEAVARIGRWSELALIVEAKGIPLGHILLTCTLITMLFCGTGLLIGYQIRLCAVALIVCTLGWLVFAHDFWSILNPDRRANEYQTFALGMTLIGGLLLLMGDKVQRFALDACLKSEKDA
jgi:uncharacterized membrane protein YphA (DoxX/SURF4 family)